MTKETIPSQFKREAEDLIRQIEEAVPVYPGTFPDAVEKARQIQFTIASGPYGLLARSKISELVGWLEIWCSPRRWEKWHPETLRSVIAQVQAAAIKGIAQDLLR